MHHFDRQDRNRFESNPVQTCSDNETVRSDIHSDNETLPEIPLRRSRSKSLPKDILFRNFVASRGRPRQKRNGGPANPGRRVHVNEVNAGGTLKETNFTTKETKKRGRPVGSKNKPKQPGIENQKSKKPGPGQSRSSANISKTVNDFIESLDRSSINSEVPSRISRPVTSDNRLNRCKKSTRTFSTELDAIAESIESPELTPHTSISSSRVTRSMSTKQRLTTTSPSSHHEHFSEIFVGGLLLSY